MNRRFVEIRGQGCNEWFVVEFYRGDPKVMCACTGSRGRTNAAEICKILNLAHDDLIEKVMGKKLVIEFESDMGAKDA